MNTYLGKSGKDDLWLMLSISKDGLVIVLALWVFSWAWRKGVVA